MDDNLLRVSLTSLAGRYGKLLFTQAKIQSTLVLINQDLANLEFLRGKNPTLWRQLDSKVLNPKQTRQLWHKIGEKFSLQSFTVKYMVFLSLARRLSLWQNILECYYDLCNDFQQKTVVKVETAISLLKKDRQKLEEIIEKLLKTNIEIIFTVNPSLKLGMIINSSNLKIDMSLKHHLATLSKNLRSQNLNSKHLKEL